MGTGISGKSEQPRESQSKGKQIPMARRGSAKFKKNMKSERYIAHRGTFDTKSRIIVNVVSQRQSVDRQSSRNIRNVNVTLRTQWDKTHTKCHQYIVHSRIVNPKRTSFWQTPTAKQHQQNQQRFHQQNPQAAATSSARSTKHQQHQQKPAEAAEPAPAKPAAHVPAQAASTSNHQHKQHQQQSRPATPAAQTKQHKRSSIKQQQDQNGNTQNTNMIPKVQQKPSARPKKTKILFIVDWVNLVFVTLPSEHGRSLRLSTRRYDLTRGLVG